jgi:hypothetical protein
MIEITAKFTGDVLYEKRAGRKNCICNGCGKARVVHSIRAGAVIRVPGFAESVGYYYLGQVCRECAKRLDREIKEAANV